MPCGKQYHDGTLPWPPPAMSARLASNTFLYSGVNGAFCPLISQRGTPTRIHWPRRSGYFASSAIATLVAAHSATSPSAPIACLITMVVSLVVFWSAARHLVRRTVRRRNVYRSFY